MCRCKQWRINLRRSDLDKMTPAYLNKNYRLCSKHFEDSQFMNSKRDKLVWNALPSLFDVPNPVEPVTPMRRIITKCEVASTTPKRKSRRIATDQPAHLTESPLPNTADTLDMDHIDIVSASVPPTAVDATVEKTQQPCHCSSNSTDSNSMNSPRKVKLKRQLYNLRRQFQRAARRTSVTGNCSLNNFNISRKVPAKKRAAANHALSELQQLLPAATFAIVKSQVLMAMVHKQGRRWSQQDKLFALSVFYQSRKAYKLLCKVLCLPSPRTLQRDLQKCNIYAGFSAAVMDMLSVRYKRE